MIVIFPLVILQIDDDSDRQFMEQVYLEHEKIMYYLAMKLLCDENDTADAVSSACVSLIGKITVLRSLDSCTLRSYIVSTIKNVCKDMLRRRNRTSQRSFHGESDEVFDHVEDENANVEDTLMLLLDSENLQMAISRLSEKERDLITWKYFYGFSDQKIAGNLNIGNGSVRAYLTKARRHLYDILRDKEND